MMKKRNLLAVILLVTLLFTNSVNVFAVAKSTTTTPLAPTLSYSPSAPTNGNVTVTIYYPNTAVVKQYKLGTNGTWIKYSSPVVVTSNTYIGAQYQNSAGKWSTTGGVAISNIDKTAPSNPIITVPTTVPTNQNITATITFSSDSTVKQYRIGSTATWTSYTAPIILSSNNTIYARASDSVGNWTSIVSYSIGNIDKTAPVPPVLTPDTVSPTNGSVNVSISYPIDANIMQYKIGTDRSWSNYSAPLVVSSNVTIYASAQDIAGNWSSESSLTVSNIDTTPPVAPTFTASTTELTNQDVSISINYSNDSILRQYKISDSGTWTDYNSPISLSSNSTVYGRSSDNAGNWSSEVNYVISNIDTTSPEIPTFNASTTEPTNQPVTISISYSPDSVVKQYRLGINGIWTDYTSLISVDSNDTIYGKAADSAGNWTTEESYQVVNIDKTAPTDPIFTASETNPTNQNVNLDIIFSDDSSIKQYKIGFSGEWIAYTSSIMFTTNNTIYARASDNAGNWTPEVNYEVSNIDSTPPEIPTFSVSTTLPTNQPVTLTISYSSDSMVKQYKIGVSGTWTAYLSPISIGSNSTIYARSNDSVGNWSSETSYILTNIVPSKMVLGYTVKNSSVDMASYNSMVTNTSVLNEIATATYIVDGYGNLTGTAPTDQINYANNNGLRPNLMVGNNFDATISKLLLENSTNRQNLKNNILNLLITNNYKGVDIDIENIPAADRNYFTTFMSEIYSTLKPLGFGVSVAVQAKTYDSPSATWNYAFDYKSLAMYADYIMLMAYDEHYPGGTPGAVASIDFVTSVVDYALTVVPKEKIVLGLAAYGYDWSNGTTKSYSINTCYTIAANNGATVKLDSTTKSKYFNYTLSGVAHSVWFEDADTIAFKLDLVNSRDLKGIGIWRLGLENTYYWNAIKSKLNK